MPDVSAVPQTENGQPVTQNNNVPPKAGINAGVVMNMLDIKGIRDKERKELKIVPGAWFFVEISLGTKSEMSSALQLAADKTQGSGEMSLNIILYARMGKDSSSEYGLDIRNLVLLGGSLELNASGTYKPAFTNPNPSL